MWESILLAHPCLNYGLLQQSKSCYQEVSTEQQRPIAEGSPMSESRSWVLSSTLHVEMSWFGTLDTRPKFVDNTLQEGCEQSLGRLLQHLVIMQTSAFVTWFGVRVITFFWWISHVTLDVIITGIRPISSSSWSLNAITVLQWQELPVRHGGIHSVQQNVLWPRFHVASHHQYPP